MMIEMADPDISEVDLLPPGWKEFTAGGCNRRFRHLPTDCMLTWETATGAWRLWDKLNVLIEAFPDVVEDDAEMALLLAGRKLPPTKIKVATAPPQQPGQTNQSFQGAAGVVAAELIRKGYDSAL